MNLAALLSQRMAAPGAQGAFQDVTGNPAAQALASGPTAVGSDKQEPMDMDQANMGDGNEQAGPDASSTGMPGDAGLGMLESAHASAHGKKKEAYGKAIKHGQAKMKGFHSRGADHAHISGHLKSKEGGPRSGHAGAMGG